jgi:hypothetical protein
VWGGPNRRCTAGGRPSRGGPRRQGTPPPHAAPPRGISWGGGEVQASGAGFGVQVSGQEGRGAAAPGLSPWSVRPQSWAAARSPRTCHPMTRTRSSSRPCRPAPPRHITKLSRHFTKLCSANPQARAAAVGGSRCAALPRCVPGVCKARRTWKAHQPWAIPPPPSRTKWTRRVPHPVRIGPAASLSQGGGSKRTSPWPCPRPSRPSTCPWPAPRRAPARHGARRRGAPTRASRGASRSRGVYRGVNKGSVQ